MCFGFVCITRRGMVYFGASIHIFVTFILFVGSSIRAFQISSYDRDDNRKEVVGGVVIAVYFFILLMLGCLIFRATEQRNPKLLGWTCATFTILETFAFLINLMFLSPVGGTYDEYGFRNFGFSMNIVYVMLSCLFLIFMMAYCATIIMYISQLKEELSEEYEDFEEASSASRVISRASSGSTFFNQRSQSQNQLDQKPSGGNGTFNILEVIKEAKRQEQLKEVRSKGGTSSTANATTAPRSSSSRPPQKQAVNKTGANQKPQSSQGQGQQFNILEVVKEAKRQQQLKEQKELREKQRQKQEKDAKKTKHPHPHQEKSRRPHTPQQQQHQPHYEPRKDEEKRMEVGVSELDASVERPNVHTQATQSEPHPLSAVAQMQPHPRSSTPQMKSQEQQTQTPPAIPQHYSQVPNLLPTYTINQSQTLPHRRNQLQQMHVQPPIQSIEASSRPYFLQEYGQRGGILSAPSFSSIINTSTASIVPHRFRSPASNLRTTKSGTLGRHESITPPPLPPLGTRIQSLQRHTSSSCSSFDPMNPNYDLEQWEQPRVQALKYTHNPIQTPPNYNALRRGTHRSDYYGVEI